MKIGKNLTPELQAIQEEIEGHAREYGLDFFPTIFEVLDYDQINQVAAFGGFPTRYPHWRFGMEYEQISKGYTYGLQKIYEMVINNNPCYAYLLESNALVDQKTVISHVLAHNDFFKNNEFFKHTNRRMIDEMANHAIRVRRYMDRFGIEEIENFIDACLSIDNLIDYQSPYFEEMEPQKKRRPLADSRDGEEKEESPVSKLPSKEYMNSFINPQNYLKQQEQKAAEKKARKKRFPPKPIKDVLWFLIQHAPLETWQRDVLSIIREEAYYYAPQGQTKILNEGWACVAADTPVFTEAGLRTMAEVVAGEARSVFDGEQRQQVYDQHIIHNHETLHLQTRCGFSLCGSTNHRVLLADGQTWCRLDQLQPGTRLALPKGISLWPQDECKLSCSWAAPSASSLSPETKKHHSLASQRGSPAVQSASSLALELKEQSTLPPVSLAGSLALDHDFAQNPALAQQSDSSQEELPALSLQPSPQQALHFPRRVNEKLAAFLGYLLGDEEPDPAAQALGRDGGEKRGEGDHGPVAQVPGRTTPQKVQDPRHDLPAQMPGLTSTSQQIANAFLALAQELFEIPVSLQQRAKRWQVRLHAPDLGDFFEEHLGFSLSLPPAARKIPQTILSSPRHVVLAFLRAFFDSRAHIDSNSITLRCQSDNLTRQLQLLLLQLQILSQREPGAEGSWLLQMEGASAARFARQIGSDLPPKEQLLQHFIANESLFPPESWEDEVLSLEEGRQDVYDISVSQTHRYCAAGLINHNSFWHAKMMTEKAATDGEIIDFADSHSGIVAMSRTQLNPYKLGLELLRDIRERWDRGQFGKEYEECEDMQVRHNWDRKLGQGMEKIFQVRRLYNDVTFVDEFLTPDFARKNKMFGFDYNRRSNQFEISTRDFQKIKDKLLFQLTNFGQPFIRVLDGNFDNRAELLLGHRHESIDLRIDYARAVLENIYKIWQRPVNISTRLDNKGRLLSFDGQEHSLKEFEYIEVPD